MRADTPAFAAKNVALAKRPRYVIEQAFDDDNTVLYYFTSHADAALPGGALALANVVEGLSGTSQTLNPDTAVAMIGAINATLTDKAGVVTTTLGGQLALGRSTRRQRARFYAGFEDLPWSDYTLFQTQIVTGIDYLDGAYKFAYADVQREMRKDIFNLAKTTLAQSLGATDTTVNVYDTSAFALVAHGSSYSDAPSATVGYIKIQDEVIRYTGKSATQFTGCTRGALNTRAVEHPVDASSSADRRETVTEYVYLEMPALKLMYALLTGILHGQGGATLPAGWHLGIPTSYVRLADFTNKPDMWNTADDTQGFVVRFEALEKTDGKKFIETQLALLSGVFQPVHADGALGCRRMANISPGAAYTRLLDETSVVKYGDLKHDFGALHNIFAISWNYEPTQKRYTRSNVLIDAASIVVHKDADPLKLEFRGLHGSRHSATILAQRFDCMRDRYSWYPMRMDVTVMPSLNAFEVGEVVRVRLDNVRDFVASAGALASIDRSFEIQSIAHNWITGELTLKLFASSHPASAQPATGDATVLSDAWYTSQGTNLASVLTITGSNPGHVTANGNLAGNVDMNAAGAIYYYAGDLVIDPGVTVTINNNCQLRIKGFLTNNGTIDGKGRGLAGAVQVPTPVDEFSFNPGTSGGIGNTVAGGGVNTYYVFTFESIQGAPVYGTNDAMPVFNIMLSGAALTGLPSDLRGSSGSSGMPAKVAGLFSGYDLFSGGAGGAGGAGLAIICRGFAQGVAGKIDLSGGDGALGQVYTRPGGTEHIHAGSGAGGAPGALLVLLDGAASSATDLSEEDFIAQWGGTPIPPGTLPATYYRAPPDFQVQEFSSYFVGTGDGTTFPLPSLSGARGGCRVQYVPNTGTATPDQIAGTLLPPLAVGLASGTNELLGPFLDGTVVPRIKVTWTPAPDARVAGYDLQFKPSAESVWTFAPPAIGQASAQTWLIGVRDGVDYDVRIRSAGAVREVSDWITSTNYFVIGKTQPPSNVGVLSFTAPMLSWLSITDPDRRGYVVRYQPGASTDWDTAIQAHAEGFITETRFDTRSIVGGIVTMLVKTLDTSGNVSLSPASLQVDLRPPVATSFLISVQPDGTREFAWGPVNVADLKGYLIRYYLGTTSDWTAMSPLHTGALLASPFETNQLAAGAYTFAIKSTDLAGNESADALFITTTISDPRVAGTLEDSTEQPTWPATKTSCHADAATGWLVADGTGTWTSLPATWAGSTQWNTAPVSPIIYMRQIDVGVKTKFIPLVTITGDGSIVVEEQHSDDAITWSTYAAAGPQLFTRHIRVRATVTGTYPKLKMMRIILSGSPITEIIEDQNSASLTGAYRIGVGDVRVPITKTYSAIKKVDITLQSVGAGWSWELVDKATSVGPRIRIYNLSGLAADAVFDATVTGI